MSSSASVSILGTVGGHRIGHPRWAANAVSTFTKRVDYSTNTLNGWQRVGTGSNRLAVRRLFGSTVYKLNRATKTTYYNNVPEFNKIQQLWEKASPYIPPVTLYSVDDEPVIAMPYYPRPYLGDWKLIDDLTVTLDLFDVGSHNLRANENGSPIFIDLGE